MAEQSAAEAVERLMRLYDERDDIPREYEVPRIEQAQHIMAQARSLIARIEAAEDRVLIWQQATADAYDARHEAEVRADKAEAVLLDLVGQVVQARDGMGIYADSPSMDETLTRAQQLLEARRGR